LGGWIQRRKISEGGLECKDGWVESRRGRMLRERMMLEIENYVWLAFKNAVIVDPYM